MTQRSAPLRGLKISFRVWLIEGTAKVTRALTERAVGYRTMGENIPCVCSFLTNQGTKGVGVFYRDIDSFWTDGNKGRKWQGLKSLLVWYILVLEG